MANRILVPLALTAITVSLALAAWQPPKKAGGPEFQDNRAEAGQSEKYTLALGKMKANSEVDFADDSKSKYTLDMEGSVNSPVDENIVGIRKKFKVTEALDVAGQSVLKPQKNAPAGGASGPQYNAFFDSVAAVEVGQTPLLAHPASIRKLTLETEAVLAVKREEATIAAVVMEGFKPLIEGVSVRISKLEMSKDQELTVILDYKRSEAGTQGPFLESIHVLDADNTELGGGRWTEGDPFGKATQLTAKFKLAREQAHKSFRITSVTESKTQPLVFEVGDVFSSFPAKTTSAPSFGG